MTVKTRTILALLLVAGLLSGFVALDRHFGQMRHTRLGKFDADKRKVLRKAQNDVLVLGASTSQWLYDKVFLDQAHIEKKRMTEGLISGGHTDAFLTLTWALKDARPDAHFKTCMVGINYYFFNERYIQSRSIQHFVFTPAERIPDLMGYYGLSDDAFRMWGNYIGCHLSRVYCDNQPFQAMVERDVFGVKPADPLYPFHWKEMLDFYETHGAPKPIQAKHPFHPRGPLTNKTLVVCQAPFDDSHYKRAMLNRLMDELDPICDETALIVMPMPKACRNKPDAEDIPLFDDYLERLTFADNRNLINLTTIGGSFSQFNDSVHLNVHQAKPFARKLVQELRPIFSRTGVTLQPPSKKDKKEKRPKKVKKPKARDRRIKGPKKEKAKKRIQTFKPGLKPSLKHDGEPRFKNTHKDRR